MKRSFRAKATQRLAVAPVIVSDLSAPLVAGLEPRVFRDLVRQLGIPHLRHGQRVLVDADVLRAALASAGAPTPAEAEEDAGDVEPTADALLERMGRKRAAGGRR